MKKILLMVLAFLVIFTVPIRAATINGHEAGLADYLLAQGDKLTNPQSEIDWAKEELDVDNLTLSGDMQNVTYYQSVPGIYYYGFELTGTPDYYIIKNATRIALFENRESKDIAYFYAPALREFNIPSDSWEISHVTLGSTGGDTTVVNTVPEAPLYAMLGTGLALLGFTRIKKKMT